MLSLEQVAFFKANGYLIVRDMLSDTETKELQRWAQEVHDWTPNADSQFMPYEVTSSYLKYIQLLCIIGRKLMLTVGRK